MGGIVELRSKKKESAAKAKDQPAVQHRQEKAPRKNLARIFRQRAEIFARLANAESLAEIEQWQKEKLVADVRKARLTNSLFFKITDAEAEDMVSSWGNPHPPSSWLPILNAHKWVYKIIN